jgi:ABC-type transport system substrate-binding protein
LTIVVVSAVVLVACATGDRHLRRPAAAGDRGGTLRVAMVDPAYQGFDPQASYTQSQFELLRCCLVRTLMTYRGLPNFEGTQPVPDLATGHPSMSTDGTTWTFHLRRGIRYAPPMQDVVVTAGDIVRALLRAGTDDPGGGPGAQYLGSIEGFSEYARGDAETIAGVSTPDDHTLQIRQTSSDRSIEHLFAMPFTSPIPPLPGDPDAVLGVATGHPFAGTSKGGPPQADGYGPFLVSTGPYMVEGAEDLDLTVPPQEQTPTSGFAPGWWFDDPGSLVLVRNPSWDAATDPSRLALPDRIEVSIAPLDNPYPMLADGETDLVMGESPPPAVLRDYETSPELQDRVAAAAGNFSRFLVLNVAQPPFDDVHVRRATALAIDRASLVTTDTESLASHLIPDPLVGGLLSSWTASPSVADAGDEAAAHAEMDLSTYGADGECSGSDCRAIVRLPIEDADVAKATILRGLRSIGIEPLFRDVDCSDPRDHVALCATGWFTDFPDAGNMIVPFLHTDEGFDPSHLGASPQQLAEWGYPRQRVPSVEVDYDRCATQAGVEAAMCWARVDQLLTSEIVALITISTAEVVRVHSGDITGYVIDQAFGEPALERISVVG